MKRFLLILFIVIFTVSIILIGVGCKEIDESAARETTTPDTTEVETTIPEAAVEGKIAFVSERDGNSEIYIMNVDGSEQVNLTNNPAEDRGISFSPDGSKIIFASYRDENSEIYIMNVDGSGQVNLTNNPAEDFAPCFSP